VKPYPLDEARRVFAEAAFIRELGIELAHLSLGECHSSLAVRPEHLQQDGFVHAGVQATMADHTAGAAAATTIPEGHIVLSVEFKINLLRPARGERLNCRAKVLRAGRQVTVAESEVYAAASRPDGPGVGADEKLVSKATVTLAVVPARRAGP
jgi:uncharacterized protein (TIGR00369 family)